MLLEELMKLVFGRRWLAVVAALALCSIATPALAALPPGSAHYVGLEGSSGSSDVQIWAVGAYFPAPGVPMLVTSLRIARFAARGERPSDTWLWSSYTFSGIGLTMGATSIGVAGTSDWVNVGLGIGMLAFSAANLAITLWGHSQPKRRREVADAGGVAIVPIFGKKRDGGVFAGVGLRILSF